MYFEYETEEQCMKCGKAKHDGHPYCEDCESEEEAYFENLSLN